MSSQWHNRLYNYRAKPPADSWNHIEAALDTQEEFSSLSERLQLFEATPPPGLWNTISTELDASAGRDRAINPTYFKRRVLWRYSSVAALFMILILLTFLYNTESNISQASLLPQRSNSNKPSVFPAQQVSTVQQTQAKEPVTIEDVERKSFARLSKNESSESNSHSVQGNLRTKVDVYLASFKTSSESRLQTVIAAHKPVVSTSFIDRYIILSKSSGEAIKLPKKIYTLVTCSNSEAACRQSIEALQQKVAAPTVMAATDFASMLELLKTIDQNY